MQQLMEKSVTDNGRHGFEVNGRVEQPWRFDLAKLLTMDIVSFEDIPLICGSGEPKGRIGQCRGVLLTDIITAGSVITTEHNDTKKMFLIVSSCDGYRTVFSWQEVFNTSVGEGIIVLLEKNGVPVHDGCGAVDLFSANDFLSGPRYVKRLTRIEIVMLE
jgi:hypothetical protein